MENFFTQERFPKLWLLFQYAFGASRAKRRLALAQLGDYESVLEIGCSMGIVSQAFGAHKDVEYLGIDIDAQAIDFARKRFSHFKNLSFNCIDLNDLAESGRQFDYVLFANILHHVDDPNSVSLLKAASKLVSDEGIMILMEPDVLRPDDSLLVRQLYRLERGQFRRSREGYKALVEEAELDLKKMWSEDVSIDSLPGFTAGHLLMFVVGGALNPN